MMNLEDIAPEDRTLFENVRMIVGGVATIAAIVVPFIIIRKLVKTIENSEQYKAIEQTLS